MDDWQLLDEAGVAAARPEYDAAMDAYWNARKARIAEHAAIDAQKPVVRLDGSQVARYGPAPATPGMRSVTKWWGVVENGHRSLVFCRGRDRMAHTRVRRASIS